MNFIACSASGTGATSQFFFDGGSLALPCPASGKVTLGQRPEHIHLSDEASWRGQVTLVEPTGADTYVVVKTGVGLMFDAQSGLRLGKEGGITKASVFTKPENP